MSQAAAHPPGPRAAGRLDAAAGPVWAAAASPVVSEAPPVLPSLPTMLRPVPDLTPEDEAAFDQFAAVVARQMGLVAISVMLVATVLWWPLDAWVIPEDQVATFGRLRLRTAFVEALTVAVVAVLPPRPGLTIPVGVVCYAAVVGAITYSLGEAPGDIATYDFGWLGDAWLGLVPLAFIPLSLRHRVLTTVFVAAVMASAFFAAGPHLAAAPAAVGQVSFAAFAVLFSVAAGEAMTRVTRRGFFARRSLDRSNAALEALTGNLAEQVADRTAQLARLTRHLDDVLEGERRRIAHDLHDDLGQQLTVMRYTLARLAPHVAGETNTELLEDLGAVLDGTSRAMRGVIARLRPRILDDHGLEAATEWLVEELERRAEVPCTLTVSDAFREAAPGLTDVEELALFRAVQESTTNALKHARAHAVRVRLDADGADVVGEVADDGVGFDPDAAHQGLGLLHLQERFRSLDGAYVITSGTGQGTAVRATVPRRRRVP